MITNKINANFYGVCVYCKKKLNIEKNKEKVCDSMIFHVSDSVYDSTDDIYIWGCCCAHVGRKADAIEDDKCAGDHLLQLDKRLHLFK